MEAYILSEKGFMWIRVHERRARVPGGSGCASNGEFDWTPSTGILWRLEINIERHPRY
jgi:hypothetical protein